MVSERERERERAGGREGGGLSHQLPAVCTQEPSTPHERRFRGAHFLFAIALPPSSSTKISLSHTHTLFLSLGLLNRSLGATSLAVWHRRQQSHAEERTRLSLYVCLCAGAWASSCAMLASSSSCRVAHGRTLLLHQRACHLANAIHLPRLAGMWESLMQCVALTAPLAYPEPTRIRTTNSDCPAWCFRLHQTCLHVQFVQSVITAFTRRGQARDDGVPGGRGMSVCAMWRYLSSERRVPRPGVQTGGRR